MKTKMPAELQPTDMLLDTEGQPVEVIGMDAGNPAVVLVYTPYSSTPLVMRRDLSVVIA